MGKWLFNFFSSVKLAVVLLALGLILVFWGTLAQVKLGLFQAQHEFFRSWFIYWQPSGANWRLPIFPGGYLVGGLFLINLFVAHLRYYRKGWKHVGIVMIHLGIVLLLLGQFLTDTLSVESYMTIQEGEASNYSESNGRWELAIVDTSDPKEDKVVAIPVSLLTHDRELANPELPFDVRPLAFYANSAVATKATDGFEPVQAENTEDFKVWWRGLPRVTEMNRRDVPSAIVELISPTGEKRDVFVSGHFARPQTLSAGGRDYQLALRPERYYKPFYLHLIDFRFDRYAGTAIPKNFSSRVRLDRPDTGENRELTIRMNEPLRYGGKTFFQASYDEATEQATVLQVVDNPGWLTPYFACVLVAAGMIWQFMIHLVGFATRRRKATA
ncbi:MAG: cytochrome c biogenesis protein ResB [Verrucomicrobiae bacterium]|nr:cytochrome c biogenesis protein ResB [Verrucomicrobiae bacterium]